MEPALRTFLVGQLVHEHDLVRIVEGLEYPQSPTSCLHERVPYLANVGAKRGHVVYHHDAHDDDAGRSRGGILDEVEPFDELAREDSGQVLDADGVEPFEEGPGAQ